MTGAGRNGCTVTVKPWVTLLPAMLADTVTGWLPSWLDVGVQLMMPMAEMVMPVGAVVSS